MLDICKFPRSNRAFTLVELMVTTAILAVILLLIFNITQQTTDAWKNSAAKIESFQGARAAFESMTRRISQATLNTYYDYFDASGNTRGSNPNFVPSKYGRYSDLHFITGKNLIPNQVTHSIFFQAPTGYSEDSLAKGLETTLNGCGYFIEYNKDEARPNFLSSLNPAPPEQYRFRLMEFVQPAEKLSIYSDDPIAQSRRWFENPLSPPPGSVRPVRQMAQNIVALAIHPKRTDKDAAKIANAADRQLAPAYEYDSRRLAASTVQPVTENQLPPLVEIVMVAVDEPSFSRFGNTTSAPAVFADAQSRYFRAIANEEDLDAELREWEKTLNAAPGNLSGNRQRLRYQIFRTEVPIRAAKWSE